VVLVLMDDWALNRSAPMAEPVSRPGPAALPAASAPSTAEWPGPVGFPALLSDRYEVVRLIGAGAMTRVVEARDRWEGRRVALKVPIESLEHDEAFQARLAREARVAAGLSHPNAAAIYTLGRHDQVRFVVTELVDGPNLRDLLAVRGPLPPTGAARVAAEVCAALAAAHEQGFTHGHLTLTNVLLAIDGRVKVTDFRLAQAAQPQASVPDPAADLRGLGRCLAAMLTGREPVAGKPVGLHPGIPAELATVVVRVANLETGYRSAADLGRVLDHFLSGLGPGAVRPVQPDAVPGRNLPAVADAASSQIAQLVPSPGATRPGRRPRPAGWPRLARLVVAAVVAAVVAGLALVGVAAVGGPGGGQPARPVTGQVWAPSSTTILAPPTSQPAAGRAPATGGAPAAGRAPATTASPTTALAAGALPTATSQPTTTTAQAGSAQRIVPDVVGLHRGQAADVLAQAQLGIHAVLRIVEDSGQVQRVVAQEPSAGLVVPAGSEVTVVIGIRKRTGDAAVN
jgi:tRNA A-37 threonylcarbamoyl transferase component Bud32